MGIYKKRKSINAGLFGLDGEIKGILWGLFLTLECFSNKHTDKPAFSLRISVNYVFFGNS